MNELHQSPLIIRKSDIELVVEGKSLYAVKAVLSMMSPAFDAMFNSDFREKREASIHLPDDSYKAMFELIELTHVMGDLDYDNIELILPTADKYQFVKILKKCEERMSCLANFYKTTERCVQTLILADKYNLEHTLIKCKSELLKSKFQDVKEMFAVYEISDKIMLELMPKFMDKKISEFVEVGEKLSELFSDRGLLCTQHDDLECYEHEATQLVRSTHRGYELEVEENGKFICNGCVKSLFARVGAIVYELNDKLLRNNTFMK